MYRWSGFKSLLSKSDIITSWQEKTSMNPKPKQERIVNTAWVFDVDGVISDLKDKKSNPKVLLYIYEQLAKDIPVALNTGRGLPAVIEKVINPLLQNHSDKNFLKNLFVVGEKGATWLTFDKNGKPTKHVDLTISFPTLLRKSVKNLIASKYSHSMFFDETKDTMISVEMKDGYDIKKYLKEQKELIPQVSKLINQHSKKNKLKLEPNQIALDVQDKRVGKHIGIRRLLIWLKDKQIKVKTFTTIGDNLSDIKMAEELHKNNFPVTHVHVGEKEIKSKYPFRLITSGKHYTQGTEEFLQNLRNKSSTNSVLDKAL